MPGPLLFQQIGQPRHRLFKLIARDGKTRSHTMAAPLEEPAFPREALDAGPKVDTGDRAPRSLAFVPVQSDDDCRAACVFLEPRRNDANNARMPTFASSPDQRRVQTARLGLFKRCRTHRRFDLAPFRVEHLQTLSHSLSFCWIRCGQQPCAQISLTDPAASIHARSKHIPQMVSLRRSLQTGNIGQGGQPRPRTTSHDFQPLMDQSTINAPQRRHIRDSRQSHKVKHRQQIRALLARLAHLATRFDQHEKHDRGCT